jgi:hypothetical protein
VPQVTILRMHHFRPWGCVPLSYMFDELDLLIFITL